MAESVWVEGEKLSSAEESVYATVVGVESMGGSFLGATVMTLLSSPPELVSLSEDKKVRVRDAVSPVEFE